MEERNLSREEKLFWTGATRFNCWEYAFKPFEVQCKIVLKWTNEKNPHSEKKTVDPPPPPLGVRGDFGWMVISEGEVVNCGVRPSFPYQLCPLELCQSEVSFTIIMIHPHNSRSNPLFCRLTFWEDFFSFCGSLLMCVNKEECPVGSRRNPSSWDRTRTLHFWSCFLNTVSARGLLLSHCCCVKSAQTLPNSEVVLYDYNI